MEARLLLSNAGLASLLSRVAGPGQRQGSHFARGNRSMANEAFPFDGASVALYVPKLGARSRRLTPNADGSFSFARLMSVKSYWIQVLSEGYFVGEFTQLSRFPDTRASMMTWCWKRANRSTAIRTCARPKPYAASRALLTGWTRMTGSLPCTSSRTPPPSARYTRPPRP